jgi:hypothetical protein
MPLPLLIGILVVLIQTQLSALNAGGKSAASLITMTIGKEIEILG